MSHFHICVVIRKCVVCTSLQIKPYVLILNALDTGEMPSPGWRLQLDLIIITPTSSHHEHSKQAQFSSLAALRAAANTCHFPPRGLFALVRSERKGGVVGRLLWRLTRGTVIKCSFALRALQVGTLSPLSCPPPSLLPVEVLEMPPLSALPPLY